MAYTSRLALPWLQEVDEIACHLPTITDRYLTGWKTSEMENTVGRVWKYYLTLLSPFR